jgi:hypothetical protein
VESGEFDFTNHSPNVRLIRSLGRHGHRERAVIAALLTEWNVNVDAGLQNR